MVFYLTSFFNSTLNIVVYGLTIILLVQILLYEREKRSFYKQGECLSDNLQLKYLFIAQSDILGNSKNVYELHHMPKTFLNGFLRKSESYNHVMKNYRAGLKEDFENLYDWQIKTGATVITTTHTSMHRNWKDACEKFKVIEMNNNIDPYAEMNYLQWCMASFCTTGRFKVSKKPKVWNSYLWIT